MWLWELGTYIHIASKGEAPALPSANKLSDPVQIRVAACAAKWYGKRL